MASETSQSQFRLYRARKLLDANLKTLNALAEALLEFEVLGADGVDKILKDTGATGEVSYSNS